MPEDVSRETQMHVNTKSAAVNTVNQQLYLHMIIYVKVSSSTIITHSHSLVNTTHVTCEITAKHLAIIYYINIIL